MPVKAIYPGTFDPPTNGHLDLIQRAAPGIFDLLRCAILINPVKNPLFTVEERVEMLKEATTGIGHCLLAPATFDAPRRSRGSHAARGPPRPYCRARIRAVSRPQSREFQMALTNRRPSLRVSRVAFCEPAGRYSFVSSRMVKEVFSFGGDITGLVPPNVLKRLRARINNGS